MNKKNTDPFEQLITKQEYPQMPPSFHQALIAGLEGPSRASEKNAPVSHRRSARKKRSRLLLIPAAAALLGLTAFAAARFHLEDLFPERLSSPEAQELIQTEPEVQVEETSRLSKVVATQEMESEVAARPALPDHSPLLDIQETMFDGTMLYIYGTVTDNGRQYTLNSDRLYINGEEIGPVSTSPLFEEDMLTSVSGTASESATEESGITDSSTAESTARESGIVSSNTTGSTTEESDMAGSSVVESTADTPEPYGYSFLVDLSSLHLTEDFEVTLPLSVYEKGPYDYTGIPLEEADTYEPSLRYQNQDLSFTVTVSSTATVASDQSFTYDDFTLEISQISVSASAIKAQFFYRMTPEQLDTYNTRQETEGKSLISPLLKNSDGAACQTTGGSSLDQENGILYIMEYTGPISPEDDSFTVVTQIGTADADGKIDVSAAEDYAESTVTLS